MFLLNYTLNIDQNITNDYINTWEQTLNKTSNCNDNFITPESLASFKNPHRIRVVAFIGLSQPIVLWRPTSPNGCEALVSAMDLNMSNDSSDQRVEYFSISVSKWVHQPPA